MLTKCRPSPSISATAALISSRHTSCPGLTPSAGRRPRRSRASAAAPPQGHAPAARTARDRRAGSHDRARDRTMRHRSRRARRRRARSPASSSRCANVLGVSGPVGQHERDRPHPLEPMMHAQLVPGWPITSAARPCPGIRKCWSSDTPDVGSNGRDSYRRAGSLSRTEALIHRRAHAQNSPQSPWPAPESQRQQAARSHTRDAGGARGGPLACRTMRLPAAPAPHLASAADCVMMARPRAMSRGGRVMPTRRATFVRATRDLADGTDAVRVAALLARGYEGFLLSSGRRHCRPLLLPASRRRDARVRGLVGRNLRASGLIANAALDFIAYARATAGIVRVRVGTGEHPIAHRLLAPLAPVAAQLGWRLRDGCWLDF